MVFISVSNEYILLYGGINAGTGEVLDDAFLLINDIWIQAK